ncbi:FAD-linked oxidase C-terminal domain-containing protein [Desulfovibrio sp. 86]|uniref:Glycolate oxidase subunit GlcD n=1 Tax=uncultured Desulfovibrio sp. TaxID=167968 RepID=A0A212LA30_9BACT|nr:FAD-linked oxidase C-terminal domain-containing protein [Desulfovibrio sp. 86]SCM74396.1 Glycolate oxidase subunit GlcD [uncultured Desulfovibrio sp.]VZH34809.1 Glycolate oxidase subunit GlcD [Desulfovibrio sp. 86]
MQDAQIIKAVSDIVGSENVVSDKEELVCYLFNARSRELSPNLPVLAVQPHTSAEVSQIMRLAYEHAIPVIPRGQGSCLSDNTTIDMPGTIILSLTHFKKIDIDPATLTAVVGPGAVTADIKKIAATHGLFYPPDPASFAYSTIGGNVATDAGGLQCVKYGTTKSYVAGLEVVLPTGDIIHCGSKCIKDVTGYNLTQLFTGSEGTLGVITEIILKLIPLPEGKKAMLAAFADVDKAAHAISEIMVSGVVPSIMEFMDNTLIRAVEEATHQGFPVDAAAMLLIEVDGYNNTLDAQAEKIRTVCERLGAVQIRIAATAEEAAHIWTARRMSLSALYKKARSRLSGDPAAPINRLADVLRKLEELGKKHNIVTGCYGHAGDGNVHPCILFNTDEEHQRAVQLRGEFHEYIISIGGTVSAEHGVGHEKIHYLERQLGKAQLHCLISIKKAIDPKNIMNPGCIFGEYIHG